MTLEASCKFPLSQVVPAPRRPLHLLGLTSGFLLTNNAHQI